MRRILLGITACAFFVTCVSGCSSLGFRLMWSQNEHRGVTQVGDQLIPIPAEPIPFYMGALFDGVCVTAGELASLFCLVDLPFSAALDTLLLPYDVYDQVRYRWEMAAHLDRTRALRRRLPP